MREKLIPLGVIVLLIGGALLAAHQQDVTSKHKAKVAAAARAKLPYCVTENPQIVIPVDQQHSLELVILSHLNTVPAGTSANIQFSEYAANQQAAGSVRYGSGYGNYNFILLQTGKSQGIRDSSGTTDAGWKLNLFYPCQIKT